MSAIATRMTVDEFLALPDEETYGKELIHGEIVDMGKSGKFHDWLKSNALEFVLPSVMRHRHHEMRAQAVWVLHASAQTIEVHRPDGTSVKLRRNDWIDAPGIIPDFRVEVADFFEGID